jgi:hypothetical protein
MVYKQDHINIGQRAITNMVSDGDEIVQEKDCFPEKVILRLCHVNNLQR